MKTSTFGKPMKHLLILLALLGFFPGEFVFAQANYNFNRLNKLDVFVLEDGAGKAAIKFAGLSHVDRERKVRDELRLEAEQLIGDKLKAGEENFIEVLAHEQIVKAGLPAPVKEWLDAVIDGKVQRVWGYKKPDNPNQIVYIPGDKPR